MKNTGFRLTLIALFIFVLAACQLTTEPSPDADQLADTSWHVTSIDGNDIVFDAMITIAFEGNQLSGVAGCNNYFGSIAPSGAEVMFGQIGSTRRACEPALMDQEQTFLHALASIASYRIEQDSVLLLFDVDGNLRIRATINDAGDQAQLEIVPQDAIASHESVFHCDESTQLSVKFVGPETIAMTVGAGGEASILSRSKSASGARYQNARYEFWNKGESARFTDQEKEYQCIRHH